MRSPCFPKKREDSCTAKIHKYEKMKTGCWRGLNHIFVQRFFTIGGFHAFKSI